MKTPLDTKEVAGLIQGFLLERGITVGRCDALELASRIKGLRNLHEDQARIGTDGSPADERLDETITISPEEFSGYLTTVAFLLKNTLVVGRSLRTANSMPHPSNVLVLGKYLEDQCDRAASLSEACQKAHVPEAYQALIASSEKTHTPWLGIEQVTIFIREIQSAGVVAPPILFPRSLLKS